MQIGATLFTRDHWAVANSTGIGVLPTCACALGGKIIPLEVELRRLYDIWPSYRPGCGRIPTVRHMIDWLVASLTPQNSRGLRTNSSIPANLKRYIRVKP